MQREAMDLGALVEKLDDIPGVVGATLGGSRAVGRQRPDSDWDFDLYYRGGLDANDVWALDSREPSWTPGTGAGSSTAEHGSPSKESESTSSSRPRFRVPLDHGGRSRPLRHRLRPWIRGGHGHPTSWQENWRCVGCFTGSCHDRPSRMR